MKDSRLRGLARRAALSAASLALLAGSAAGSDPTDFPAGELVLYSSHLFVGFPSSGLMRIDPLSGAAQVLAGPFVGGTGFGRQLAFDPHRGRALVCGQLVPGVYDLYAVDALGGVQSLGLPGAQVFNLAPAGDGRVYFQSLLQDFGQPATGIQYLDAGGVLHVLLDAAGAAPFELTPGGNQSSVRAAIYEPQTSSLFLATDPDLHSCDGVLPDVKVHVHKLPLSADGARVVGPVACAAFDVDPQSFQETPVGFGRGPLGELLLVVDTNSNAAQPRMLRIDPSTLAISAFASSEYFGVAGETAGTFSNTLGMAVVLDTLNDVLRAYPQGSAGAGLVLPAAGVSEPFGSGEFATLVEAGPVAPAGGLTASASSLSLAAGGAVAFSIDAGPAHAGLVYLVLGSSTGWHPPIVADGVLLPLALDAYTVFTLENANTATLPGSLGLLDAQGRASAAFVLPPGLNPAFAGLVLHHAAAVFDFAPQVVWATNAVACALVP